MVGEVLSWLAVTRQIDGLPKRMVWLCDSLSGMSVAAGKPSVKSHLKGNAPTLNE